MRFDSDVVVIGGGPAGSASSSWLTRAGHSVILFERDRFPRFHIGESLLACVNDSLSAIGAHDVVRTAGFPQKWGATFMRADGRDERYADFADAPDVPVPQTWQVQRAVFDDLLLKHARTCGVDVREEHRVVDVAFDKDGVDVTVKPLHAGNDADQTIRTRCVIDASGRGAALARKFDLRISEPRLRNVAVFSHYSNVPRSEGRRAGDIRIIARDDLGWFWMIPVSEELTSVGVVLPQAALRSLSDVEPDRLLARMIAETPVVARLLSVARQEWPVRVEKDFSFGSRAYAGDRWLLAGDAGSFLDPVFSTGAAIALESGVDAARATAEGLRRNDLSVRSFRQFNRRQRRRYLSFRRFVLGFYSHEFRDLFFAAEPPPRIFRSLVTVFAGYWNPSLATRMWVHIFFGLVRGRRLVRALTPTVKSSAGIHDATTPAR